MGFYIERITKGSMSKRWSKLQREIYNLMDEKINLQIHCNVYRMDSQFGGTDLPRYWITLDKNIIFDYPKQFIDMKKLVHGGYPSEHKFTTAGSLYPYITDVSAISNIIREYIDTPAVEILECRFDNDIWGLTDIFKAADRRVGRKRIKEYFQDCENDAVLKILEARNIPK